MTDSIEMFDVVVFILSIHISGMIFLCSQINTPITFCFGICTS